MFVCLFATTDKVIDQKLQIHIDLIEKKKLSQTF